MKNKIIKTVTAIMALTWLVTLTMVDSASIVPFAVFMLSTAGLAYIGWCNDWFEVAKR